MTITTGHDSAAQCDELRAARVGDRITIRTNGGSLERFLIIDPDETLSVSGPIGSAVTGAAAGATFEVLLPGERTVFVEIVAID